MIRPTAGDVGRAVTHWPPEDVAGRPGREGVVVAVLRGDRVLVRFVGDGRPRAELADDLTWS